MPYVSADETEQGVFIAPAGAQALAKEQQTNALLFEAQEKTMEDLTVYVLIQEVL